jgi:hypothetical protein
MNRCNRTTFTAETAETAETFLWPFFSASSAVILEALFDSAEQPFHEVTKNHDETKRPLAEEPS